MYKRRKHTTPPSSTQDQDVRLQREALRTHGEEFRRVDIHLRAALAEQDRLVTVAQTYRFGIARSESDIGDLEVEQRTLLREMGRLDERMRAIDHDIKTHRVVAARSSVALGETNELLEKVGNTINVYMELAQNELTAAENAAKTNNTTTRHEHSS
jgi:hypothetical protein